MILVKFIISFEIYNFKVNELIIIGIYRLKKKMVYNNWDYIFFYYFVWYVEILLVIVVWI